MIWLNISIRKHKIDKSSTKTYTGRMRAIFQLFIIVILKTFSQPKEAINLNEDDKLHENIPFDSVNDFVDFFSIWKNKESNNSSELYSNMLYVILTQ